MVEPSPSMNHRQKCALWQVFLADCKGTSCMIKKVTADALVEKGYLERVPDYPGHVRLTLAGHQWCETYTTAA